MRHSSGEAGVILNVPKTKIMAKQKSIIKLEGTIGGISFYKTQDGYLAREKTSLSASRISSDPRFQRTRENGAEFGRAGSAGKIVRRSFKDLIRQSSDNRMVSRLTAELLKVVQADAVNLRGMRNVIDGELELLSGFNFNGRVSLDQVIFMAYQSTIDRVSGTFKTDVPVFDSKLSIQSPQGSTHFTLNMGAASINFETEITDADQVSTDYLALGSVTTAPLSLEITLQPNSTDPLLLALGIIFYQHVNGVYYPLLNGAHNALSLVKISGL